MEIMKLKPVLKEIIWGGTRLKEDFKFESELDKIAEDWALSCHDNGKSIVDGGEFSGVTLDEVLKKDYVTLCGTKAAAFPYFPILIKLIDARDDLSVQVHPSDEYALINEGEFGKTEMWYIMDCTDDASLIYGFKNEISSKQFKDAIKNGTLLNELNSVKVKKGDVFFIESGTVHAIGKGILLAEIQQNSNTTYRVFDYNRIGADGKARELHVSKAVDVAKTQRANAHFLHDDDYTNYGSYSRRLLASCGLFTVNMYNVNTSVTLSSDAQSFKSVLIIDGSGKIDGIDLKKGDSFFVPANYGDFTIDGQCSAIITNI